MWDKIQDIHLKKFQVSHFPYVGFPIEYPNSKYLWKYFHQFSHKIQNICKNIFISFSHHKLLIVYKEFQQKIIWFENEIKKIFMIVGRGIASQFEIDSGASQLSKKASKTQNKLKS